MFFSHGKNPAFLVNSPRRPAPRRVGGLEEAGAEAPNGAGAVSVGDFQHQKWWISWELASGKHTKKRKIAIDIVELPMKNCDFQ